MSGQISDTTTNDLMVQKQLSYAEIANIGKAFVASGMFGRDMQRVSQAVTKIMAGQELGLAPFASMRAVHVIDGNATLSANTMAGMVKASGRYDYEVKKKEVDECIIDFYEIRNGKRTKVGTESFDKSEAQSAGLLNKQNWQKYPKAMMFARCISNGVRTFCPDVFSGMLVYTPDELNAQVNQAGDVIDVDDDGNITPKPETNQSKGGTDNANQTQEPEQYEVEEDLGSDEIQPAPSDSEPSQDISDAEIAAFDQSPATEPEQDQPLDVTEDMKEATTGLVNELGLSAKGKMALIKAETGVLTIGLIKTDDAWRKLYARAMAFANFEEAIPSDWMVEGQATLV